MPKRKRPSPLPSPDTDGVSSDRAQARQRKLCTNALAKAQKSLVQALRLGATFERQKYSRRKKTAKDKKDDKAIARLDAEYVVLKGLDIPKLAESHLRKTITKVKSLKDNEGVPGNWRAPVDKEATSTEQLNVTARLYKVKGVKEVVDEVVEELKGIVGAGAQAQKQDVDRIPREDAKRKTRTAEEEESEEDEGGEEEEEDDDDEAFAAFDARIAAPSSADEDSDASLEEGDRPPSIQDSEDEGGELAEEESEAEFTDESDLAIPREGYGYIVTSEDDDARSDSGGSDSEDETLRPLKSKSKTEAPAEKANKSTFLPSLSHANYVSGSESEASDLEDDRPKKNRRGQRARQKIWEAKYGEKAKHVQKNDKNKGWDPKRGAVGEKGSRESRAGAMKTGRGPLQSGSNEIALGPRKKAKRDDVGALHPSWQAAKAAKEKKMVAKPAGKKIVFD